MNRRLALTSLTLTCGAALLSAQSAVKRLHDVKTIYVVPFENRDDMWQLLSAKLVTYLAKQGGVWVVESPEKADALLSGTGQIQTFNDNSGRTHYRILLDDRRPAMGHFPKAKLAEALGVSKDYVYQLVRGNRVPHRRHWGHWVKLAELVGIGQLGPGLFETRHL